MLGFDMGLGFKVDFAAKVSGFNLDKFIRGRKRFEERP